ncbi:MAG: DUF4956 domain-containing protein [Lachnospiraceae bacterium]|nr:DUF4956 domain-containing protein [Lachnospiraceae bacterium]
MSTTIFTDATISLEQALIMIAVAFALGLVLSATYMLTSSFYSKNFAVSLLVIPALISIVIALIHDNQSLSLATIGAFTLIRFRSMQGTSRDLSYILSTVTIGLACGMGYVLFGSIITAIVCVVMFVLNAVNFGQPRSEKKELRVIIPENLDYTGVFDDIFDKYVKSVELVRVQTTNLGSMYELQYHIVLKNPAEEKAMIDEIRTRNGNLNIVCGKMNFSKESL